jgi:hypothetical protein
MTKNAKKTAAAPALMPETLAALVTADLQVLATSDIVSLSTDHVAALTGDVTVGLTGLSMTAAQADLGEQDRLARLHEDAQITRMQDMAQRIWDGQSPNVAVKVRVKRIETALLDQGFESIMHMLQAPEGFESAQ